MSARLNQGITNVRTAIKAALDNVMAKLDTKLNTINNFEAGASGLTATDINGAILELKSLIDALNDVYSTDAEMAASIAAVNAAWAAADTNITNLVNSKVDVATYNNDMAALNTTVNAKVDTATYTADKATFLTVDDIIDCGTL